MIKYTQRTLARKWHCQSQSIVFHSPLWIDLENSDKMIYILNLVHIKSSFYEWSDDKKNSK